jgi:transposase-like protein
MNFTIADFNKKYPDEETCLDEIFRNRFGTLIECPNKKCFKKVDVQNGNGFYRVADRKCYACQWCGYQIHPLADTIFHKSDTPLKKWFFAIWLFSNSKNGVSGKELERHLGVTYKTAWRMAKQIRLLFVQTQKQLKDTVEIDETYIGGSEINKHYVDKVKGIGNKYKTKSAVVGMVERGEEGRVVAQVMPPNLSQRSHFVTPLIRKNVKIGTQIMTDEAKYYSNLNKNKYKHRTVKHMAHEYVRGNVYTNTIEGFWSQLKRSINGTYHAVSPKYLQSYVNEFAYRYGKRNSEQPLFYPMIGLAGRPVQ